MILFNLSSALSPLRAESPSAARLWNEELLSAIRLDVPNPPGHARNLFHTAAAMYNAWAAYNPVAVGYAGNEKVTAPDVELARREAVSYAAYRVLRSRFAASAGAATTLVRLDDRLTAMGYSPATGQAAATNAPSPAELGKRCGDAILAWGAGDGFSRTGYPEAYDFTQNGNVLVPLTVLGTNAAGTANMPLGYGIPWNTDPNLWQPLALATSISQNGIPLPGGIQPFVGVQGLATTPFSLFRNDPLRPWIDLHGGPSRLSTPLVPSASDAVCKEGALSVLRDGALLNDETLVDISPASTGNNPPWTDDGHGYAANPVTGAAYTPHLVKRGDFVRVLAEFWADGPNSETPPGHWHVLANQVADTPGFQKRIGGTGPVLNDLEWDVKMYFALSAATHDAACAAWALKRYYSGARPITMIRYLADKGQCSDAALSSYHPGGLPLEPGVAELVTAASAAAGQRHERIWDVSRGDYRAGAAYIGQVVVFAWPGEHPANAPAPAVATHAQSVRWMLGRDWLPFQRKTFNTPAFPGYISGHSTFSRAAAEVLALLTGSPYFPGGLHHHTVAAYSMQMDRGPSTAVDLQWCTYYDAADQAGQSRRWGGIHVPEDDFHGREVGALAGVSAYALARKYWTGEILNDRTAVDIFAGAGAVSLEWNTVRGFRYAVQRSGDLQQWTDLSAPLAAYSQRAEFSDAASPGLPRFYRVRRTLGP